MIDLEKALRIHPDLPIFRENTLVILDLVEFIFSSEKVLPKAIVFLFCSHISSVYIIFN